MSDDLSTSLEKLRERAARLNQITDQAGAAVKAVEDFLNTVCSVGIYAEVDVCEEIGNGVGRRSERLEYCRVGQRFRIAVVQFDPPGPPSPVKQLLRPPAYPKPWSDCSRDVKLRTFAKLGDLLEAISRQLEDKIKAAEDSTKKVLSTITSLTGKGE